MSWLRLRRRSEGGLLDLLQMFDVYEVFFVLDLKGKKTGEFRHLAGEQGILSVRAFEKIIPLQSGLPNPPHQT